MKWAVWLDTASWLEALLESDDDEQHPHSQSQAQLLLSRSPTADVDLEFLESTPAGGGLTNFLRMNSSPAEFLSLFSNDSSDGYFPNLGSYGHAPKRPREAEDLDKLSPSSSTTITPVLVRRTRISDRIRKLQELVPNMDKQTNTADMLDEAVAYVKFLQQQIQELSEHQQNCKCQ